MAPMFGLSILLLYFVSFSDAACPNGSIRHGNMCYHFSHDVETWTGAKAMCEVMKMQLVEIETIQEGHFLGQQTIINGNVIEEDAWVWMNSLTPATFTLWNNGEPNGHQGDNCVVIRISGSWDDSACGHSFNFICEMEDAVIDEVGKR